MSGWTAIGDQVSTGGRSCWSPSARSSPRRPHLGGSPVERRRDQITGLLTALLSSALFSCLLAIVIPVAIFGIPGLPIEPRGIAAAVIIGFFVFWVALFFSAFFSVVGATALYLTTELLSRALGSNSGSEPRPGGP